MALINLGQRLFMNFSRADVVFVVDAEEIPGHRLILGEACPYFDKLLRGDFEESKSKCVQITGTSAKVFKEVIRFIYLGRLEILIWKIEDLLALLSSAHEYQLDQLIEAVTRALKKQSLDFDSWALVNSAASLYESEALKAMCVSFVERQIPDFLNCEHLEKFTADFVHSILDSPEVVSCNQDHLLSAICKWKTHHSSMGISSMLSKIKWTNVSPAISNFVLQDVFSNATNEENFRFWTKVDEIQKLPFDAVARVEEKAEEVKERGRVEWKTAVMKKSQSEVVARVGSVSLFESSNVEFHLEKYQCSLVLGYRLFITHYAITIGFSKPNIGGVEIPVKGIEFESATMISIRRIYGYDLKIQCSYAMVSDHTLNNGWFKCSAVFYETTPLNKISIVLENIGNLSVIRLRNLSIC